MPMTTAQSIRFLFRASLIKRYHNRTTLVEDTVGRHTFMVVWLLYLLYKGRPPYHVIMHAMKHDVAEVITGDIPAPVTRADPVVKHAIDSMEQDVLERLGLPVYPGLDEVEAKMLKLADRLEGYLFSSHEFTGLFNMRMAGVRRKYDDYVKKAIKDLPEEAQTHAWEVFKACQMLVSTVEDEEDLCL